MIDSIEQEPNLMQDLKISEPFEIQIKEEHEHTNITEDVNIAEHVTENTAYDENFVSTPPVKKRKLSLFEKDADENSHDSLDDLKREKISLEIYHLKLLNYKLELEVYEKEKNLGFAPSTFTKELAAASSIIII